MLQCLQKAHRCATTIPNLEKDVEKCRQIGVQSINLAKGVNFQKSLSSKCWTQQFTIFVKYNFEVCYDNHCFFTIRYLNEDNRLCFLFFSLHLTAYLGCIGKAAQGSSTTQLLSSGRLMIKGVIAKIKVFASFCCVKPSFLRIFVSISIMCKNKLYMTNIYFSLHNTKIN